jgi:hypothetical protein
MAIQSKITQQANLTELLKDLLMGNNNRKIVSITVLLIIGFLIHLRNKKPETDTLRNSRL